MMAKTALSMTRHMKNRMKYAALHAPPPEEFEAIDPRLAPVGLVLEEPEPDEDEEEE